MSKAMELAISILGVLVLSTCCWSWPTNDNNGYRKTYTYDSNYAAPLMLSEKEYATGVGNQWDIAQDPEYDPQELLDYYNEPVQSQPQSLYSMDPEIEDEPVWGQVIRERPETELEELKELSGIHGQKHNMAPSTTLTPPTTTSVPAAKSNVLHKFDGKPQQHHGQKEFPLLRPPNQKPLQPSAPIIQQRSLSFEKKPSPYDTLRKYLSIEDALKKEAEKRSAAKATPRQVKRNFVSDADSLTGQLNKLKKAAS